MPLLGTGLISRHAHRLPGLMLLALHAAVAWGLDSALSSALITAHFGLFLLWQPVWRGEGELATSQVILVLAIAALLAALRNWWLIALWVAALTSLAGGQVPGVASLRQRAASLLAALQPASVDYLYFVGCPGDGGAMTFSSSYAQFLRDKACLG